MLPALKEAMLVLFLVPHRKFDHKTVHWAGPNWKGHRLTVRPVEPAGPVRFLKHCYFVSAPWFFSD